MSESKFSKTVCGIITSGCGGHVSRVEAHASASGIPDLDYCAFGTEGHIELKYGHSSKKPEIRPSQVRWFRDRIKVGGEPFFLCLNGDTDMVYLLSGIRYGQLKGKCSIDDWEKLSLEKWALGDSFRQGFKNFLWARSKFIEF